MPEGRMLKKRISDSKKLGKLKSDSARLLYTWILPHLDVEGRYSADPDLIKGHVFPKVKSMTYKKITNLLCELAEVGLIILYKHDGEFYLHLKNFHDYQKIDPNKEARSKIEAPNRGSSVLTLDNSRVALENSSTSKVKGSKVKRSKVKSNESKSSCPKSKPSDEDIRLVQLLINLMLENNPKSHIIKNLTAKIQANWINSCRLLRENDNRTPQEIEAIVRFSQNDPFWKSNILSMPKLREKFDQLWLKAKKSNYSGIREWVRQQEEKYGKEK